MCDPTPVNKGSPNITNKRLLESNDLWEELFITSPIFFMLNTDIYNFLKSKQHLDNKAIVVGQVKPHMYHRAPYCG